jgi:hypothetical protein
MLLAGATGVAQAKRAPDKFLAAFTLFYRVSDKTLVLQWKQT